MDLATELGEALAFISPELVRSLVALFQRRSLGAAPAASLPQAGVPAAIPSPENPVPPITDGEAPEGVVRRGRR